MRVSAETSAEASVDLAEASGFGRTRFLVVRSFTSNILDFQMKKPQTLGNDCTTMGLVDYQTYDYKIALFGGKTASSMNE